MTHEDLMEELTELKEAESAGKELLNIRGRAMDYAEFVDYLSLPQETRSCRQLLSSASLLRQREIRLRYQQKTRAVGLREEDFFTGGKNIEIEQLLRFVDIPMHRHQFLECAYVLSGSCVHRAESRDFVQEAGCFVTIPPSIYHALFPDEDCVCLTIKVRMDTLRKLDIPDMGFFLSPMAFRCGDDPFIRHTVLSIYEQQKSALPQSQELMTLLFQTLILYIFQRYESRGYLMTAKPSNRDFQMLAILIYTARHYNTVTLHEVAQQFHYNDSYFSRMFHQELGRTFSEILREYKLRRAAELLLKSEDSVSSVCEAVGYRDPTQFIKNFKALFAMTPMQYRAANRK